MKYRKITGYTKKELVDMIRHGKETGEKTTYYFNGKHIFSGDIQDRITVLCRARNVETIQEGLDQLMNDPEILITKNWNKYVHEVI